jgi:hypothetical protein
MLAGAESAPHPDIVWRMLTRDRRFLERPEYHSAECHSGGELDLKLAGAPGSWSY